MPEEPGVVVRVPPVQPASPAMTLAPSTIRPLLAVVGSAFVKLTPVIGLVVLLLARVMRSDVVSPGYTVSLFGGSGPVLTVTLKSASCAAAGLARSSRLAVVASQQWINARRKPAAGARSDFNTSDSP